MCMLYCVWSAFSSHTPISGESLSVLNSRCGISAGRSSLVEITKTCERQKHTLHMSSHSTWHLLAHTHQNITLGNADFTNTAVTSVQCEQSRHTQTSQTKSLMQSRAPETAINCIWQILMIDATISWLVGSSGICTWRFQVSRYHCCYYCVVVF